jgi:hypothetical protein
VGATLIAWLIPSIHEVPRRGTLVGGALVLLGIALSLTQPRGDVGTWGRGKGWET